jgi:hypothetical protein
MMVERLISSHFKATMDFDIGPAIYNLTLDNGSAFTDRHPL